MTKKLNKSLKTLKKNKPYIVILSIAIIGSLLLLISNAATPYAQTELENTTLSNGATKIFDSGASGGQAIQFNASTGGGGGTLPPGLTDTAPPADPAWKPDADNPNTGVKDYSLLKPCPGGDITQGGTASAPYIIENCEFQNAVRVKAKYVTIKNSRIQGKGNYLLYVDDVPTSSDYFVGENLDLIGSGTQDACFVTWAKKTILRNSELTNCIDIIKHAGGNFEYNWIHDAVYVPPSCSGCDGSHTDLMQVQGGMVEDMVVVGNNFKMGTGSALMEMGGETTWDSTPCVMSVTLQNNWLDGYNYYWNNGIRQGTNTTYKCYPSASWKFIGNRFYRQNTSYGTTGRYEEQRNNVWHDSGQTRLNNQTINVSTGQAVNF